MKESVAQIVRYCDFCANKVASEAMCSLCGKDVCETHSIGIVLPFAASSIPPLPPIYPEDMMKHLQKLMMRLLGTTMARPVCWDCCAQPLKDLALQLAKKKP